MSNASAAVVPYGMNEDSIIYVSTDWIELCELLTNPVVFLGAKGMINSPIQWRLRPKATALVEPFDANATRAARFIGMFGRHGVTPPEPANRTAASKERLEDLGRHATEIASKELPDGAFIAEFALNTRVMVVRYKLPNRFESPDPEEAPSAAHYKGRFTAPTYIGLEGSACGNVHFDIEKQIGMTDVNRAHVAVDMLENPHRVFSRLGDHIHNTARLGALDATVPLRLDRSTKTIKPKYVFSSMRPPFVMENLSSFDTPDDCGVCIDGQTYEECTLNEDCVWYIDGVMYKCYTPPGGG